MVKKGLLLLCITTAVVCMDEDEKKEERILTGQEALTLPKIWPGPSGYSFTGLSSLVTIHNIGCEDKEEKDTSDKKGAKASPHSSKSGQRSTLLRIKLPSSLTASPDFVEGSQLTTHPQS